MAFDAQWRCAPAQVDGSGPPGVYPVAVPSHGDTNEKLQWPVSYPSGMSNNVGVCPRTSQSLYGVRDGPKKMCGILLEPTSAPYQFPGQDVGWMQVDGSGNPHMGLQLMESNLALQPQDIPHLSQAGSFQFVQRTPQNVAGADMQGTFSGGVPAATQPSDHPNRQHVAQSLRPVSFGQEVSSAMPGTLYHRLSSESLSSTDKTTFDSITDEPLSDNNMDHLMFPTNSDIETVRPNQASTHGARKPKSSQFMGITKRYKNDRWEAHIWITERKQQVYLGNFVTQEKAAVAFDLVALKVRGKHTNTNFPLTRYAPILGLLQHLCLDELVQRIRRQSKGFGRGKCGYRGVTRHSNGNWEARTGIPKTHRNIYVGLFHDMETAATAYDAAIVRLRGSAASTNFHQHLYKGQHEEHRIVANMLGFETQVYELWSTPLKSIFSKWIKTGGRQLLDELIVSWKKLSAESTNSIDDPLADICLDRKDSHPFSE